MHTCAIKLIGYFLVHACSNSVCVCVRERGRERERERERESQHWITCYELLVMLVWPRRVCVTNHNFHIVSLQMRSTSILFDERRITESNPFRCTLPSNQCKYGSLHRRRVCSVLVTTRTKP
ncbi:hypothetical protein KP509_1Z044600 [Ceratopteris richardii]|nr:hypothetical protein KP509_1Z044600 [Ceratopteris richardii]